MDSRLDIFFASYTSKRDMDDANKHAHSIAIHRQNFYYSKSLEFALDSKKRFSLVVGYFGTATVTNIDRSFASVVLNNGFHGGKVALTILYHRKHWHCKIYPKK